MAATLASCTSADRQPGTAVIASGADLESGNPVVTVHPLTRQVQRHALFVTLFRLDSALQPVPYFARRWSWAPDGRALTMVLDSTLRWHDGVPTTSNDVVFTFESARSAALGSPRRGEVMRIDSLRARGSREVTMYFHEMQRSVPPVLAELPLVPKHLLDTVPLTRWRSSAFARTPVGNGPFRFDARVAGRQWRFVRNANFPADMGGPPALQRLVVAVVDEAATKFAGLVSGELDLAGVSPSMAHLVQRDQRLVLLTPPALFSTGLVFNTTQPPFNDARVRRAVSLSLNRSRIVNAAVAGFGVPATSALPPGLPVSPQVSAPSPEQVAHNQHLADSLLDAAGWVRPSPGRTRARQGVPLAVELLTVGSGEMAIEQLVQADLAARGIDVTIRVMELTTFLSTVRAPARRFQLAVTGIPGDIALAHLSAMFATSQQGGALDYTGFHSPALDATLAAAREAPPTAAAAAWARVDSLLLAESPVAWIYHARGVQGKALALGGVTMDLRGELVTVSRWTHP